MQITMEQESQNVCPCGQLLTEGWVPQFGHSDIWFRFFLFSFFRDFGRFFSVFIKTKKHRLHMDFFPNSSTTTPQCSSHLMCLSRFSSCSSLPQSRQHLIFQMSRSISEYEIFTLPSTSSRPTRSLFRTSKSSRTCRNQLSTKNVHSCHLTLRSGSCPVDIQRACSPTTAVVASC